MENDYVTKAEAQATKVELVERIDTTRLELLERIETTRLELVERIETTRLELVERIDASRLELLERTEKVETTLLTEFRKWARSFESRTRVTELTVAGLHERMGLIEDRVSELEHPSPK